MLMYMNMNTDTFLCEFVNAGIKARMHELMHLSMMCESIQYLQMYNKYARTLW